MVALTNKPISETSRGFGLALPILGNQTPPPSTADSVADASRPAADYHVSHWSRRRSFHPGSLPQHMAVTVLDLDTTKNCNLRCGYCFKSEGVYPGATRTSLDTAMTAIEWLLAASYSATEVWVNLFGGEPLLAFPMVKELVPYAKRRAASMGKSIQFGCTSNLTLINEDIRAFFEEWGMGWHCSIDGGPEVQNKQRPGVGGAESSSKAERGAKFVLRDRPGAMARATLTPANIAHLLDSVRYFESVGFSVMGFAVADENTWTDADLAAYDQQLGRIRDYVRDNWFRKGVDRDFSAFDYIIRAQLEGAQQEHSCGAGRGMVLIDERGDMWPCHRWDGADLDSKGGRSWRFGNMYEDGFNHLMHLAMLDRDRWAMYKPGCSLCPMNKICAGGCAAANLVLSESIYYQDFTSCEVSRINYKHAMRLHDELLAEQNPLFMLKYYSKDYQRKDSFSEQGENGSAQLAAAPAA